MPRKTQKRSFAPVAAPDYSNTVLSRDRKLRGVLTGGSRRCQLEGCTGRKLGVRWPDGKITWPCTKGMQPAAYPNSYIIL